jgi:ribosome-binding protein aMBF1 (putative translation factor)
LPVPGFARESTKAGAATVARCRDGVRGAVRRRTSDADRGARQGVTEEEALAAEMRRLRAEDPRAGLPSELFRRILAGESAIRVWREYRGLAPDVLAERVGVPAHVLADAEARPDGSSIETLRAIARELDVPLDELL